MFIDEKEALRRLKSSNNLLVRLRRSSEDEPKPEIQPDEVDDALEEARQNPTFPSEDDAIRLAVLAGRRHLKVGSERAGRYPQQGNVPPIFRALIGSAAQLGSAKETARNWGVSQVTALNYKHGRLANDIEPNSGLVQQIEDNTLAVRNQVLGILSYTVAGITPEALVDKDAKELSIIARNLSAIISSTKPAADFGDKTTNAQVIVFSPEQEKEVAYDTIEVG